MIRGVQMISDELKSFLENNEMTFDENWRKRISEVDPNWESTFKNPKNWKELENFVRRYDYDDLFHYEHGYDIWEIINVSPDEWNFHSDEMKEYIIEHIFEYHPGEPFNLIKNMRCREGGMVIILGSYIPSYKVRKLKETIEKAGDVKFQKYINERIRERMGFINQISMAAGSNVSAMPSSSNRNLRILYQPTPYERELIAHLLSFFKNEGYSIISLPGIYLSYETPPLFLLYPDLEPSLQEFDIGGDYFGKNDRNSESNRDNEARGRSNKPRNNDQIRPETISIEEVLGLYCPTPDPHIILYQKGIYWVSRDFNIDIDQLRAVVLIHEIGHWIMHQLPHPIARQYDVELFNYTAEDLHECWAQLLTNWVAENNRYAAFRQAFDDLNQHQSLIYKSFSEYVHYSEKDIIDSLIKLRGVRFPASLKIWHDYCL
jgi:hypothetical protein